MLLETLSCHLPTRAWSRPMPALDSERTLVLAFGAPSANATPEVFEQLRAAFPKAVFLGCSGAGEIHGAEIRDRSLSVAVARFQHTDLRSASVRVEDPTSSFAAGAALARKLAAPTLRAVFVLSEGLKVNGSELVRGFNETLPGDVVVTGGLAGDGTQFGHTWVVHGRELAEGVVAAVGFYGDRIHVGHASKGGWDRFGPERTVTHADGNVLYALDDQPALALYKQYLGPRAAELPASGLLFPLAMRASATDEKVLVRTLLAVDEARQSMTFAGDLPLGSRVQLMKADFERLIHGAEGAAAGARVGVDEGTPVLALAVSCVGRRLVLGERTEEEVEAVRDALPPGSSLVGFYSYGELGPYATGSCDLHNQTMTLTTFHEDEDGEHVEDANEQTDTGLSFQIAPDETAPFGRGGQLVVRSSVCVDGVFHPELPDFDGEQTLVLVFGASEAYAPALRAIGEAYPRAVIAGCSGAGQIHGVEVLDRGLSIAVARFGRTRLRSATVPCEEGGRSLDAGRALGRALAGPDLRAVFVLSEGLTVNGSDLVRGLGEVLGVDVVVTGGLAGDGTRFQRTWVARREVPGGPIEVGPGAVVAVGFYGDHVSVGHGSKGGWDAFGPLRTVTHAVGNVLHTLDGQPALALYKQYLGARAADLPASGLLFPLAITRPGDDKVLVRTLLAVDEAAQTLIFAGDVPVGAHAQLMKADFERLVGGARGATEFAQRLAPPVRGSDTLAVAVSCVGRRLVLGDRTEEEVEAVRDTLPPDAVITGFYSYGELSPHTTGACDLHNQTMTLTTFSESSTPVSRPVSRPAPRPSSSPVEAQKPLAPKPGASIGEVGAMQAAAFSYDLAAGKWSIPRPPALDGPRTLVLAFGPSSVLDNPDAVTSLSRAFPSAQVLGCSTSGEIVGREVKDGVVSVVVLKFAHTDLASATVEVQSAADSYGAGRRLARALDAPGLRAVFVLSEGLQVNGTDLVRGLDEVLGSSVVITGGLAGDGPRFQRTWVAYGGVVKSGLVAAVGFYGDHVVVGHGSKGGWDAFGPERLVTRAVGNVVHEIDGRPALALYKEYLGPRAAELPASGLLFPLALRRDANDDQVLVRTLLAVDEEKQTLTFAGDVPTGHLVQLMKADFDRLVDGAEAAASAARGFAPPVDSATVAVAVSCVGRRLVLGDRTEDEVEAVADALPEGALLAGFYSYGELSPFGTGSCRLHNQTMTLTTFAESPTPLARPARRPTAVTAPPGSGPVPPRPAPVAATSPDTQILNQRVQPARDGTGTSAVRARGARVTVLRSPEKTVVGLEVTERVVGPVTVVSPVGRLNEQFQGGVLGRRLQGEVVFDLSRVERVTSFGVREWLALLKDSEGRADHLWMAQCSEAVVNQITMIRGFAGRAKVTSFFAPYSCGACGTTYAALIDALHDRDAVEAMVPPETACPRCRAPGSFDDDPQSYFALLPNLATSVPEAVVRALGTLDATGAAEAVEKRIEGRVTRIRVSAALDANLRWSRILDGVEGQVLLDLAGVSTTSTEGLAGLEQGLRSVAADVEELALAAAPRAVVERLLGARGLPKLALRSVTAEAQCPTCAQPRTVLVDLDADGARIRAGADPEQGCRRCGGPLSYEGCGAFLRQAAQGTVLRPAEPTPPRLSSPSMPPAAGAPGRASIESAPAIVVAAPVPSGPGWFGVAAAAVAAASLAVLSLVACAGLFGGLGGGVAPAPAVAPVAAPVVAATWSGGDELPPPWTEVPVTVGADAVLVVGHGGPSATDEEALTSARRQALVRLVTELSTAVAPPVRDAVASRVRGEPTGEAAARVADRFLKDLGSRATPERTDTSVRTRDGAHEAYARYALDRATWDALVAQSGATEDLAGARVAQFFPLLAATLTSDADLWVVESARGPAARSGVNVGDLLLSANGQPLRTLGDLEPRGTGLWEATPAGGALVLVLEANGAPRTVRLGRPKPPRTP